MSSQTHIVILKMRTIIYTLIFAFLLIIFGVLMFFMFNQKKNTEPVVTAPAVSSSVSASGSISNSVSSLYYPGCYNSVLNLGEYTATVSITVNNSSIESIQLTDTSAQSLEAYPLLKPALEDLAEQVLKNQSTEGISYAENMQYTQSVLLKTIGTALQKASINSSH